MQLQKDNERSSTQLEGLRLNSHTLSCPLNKYKAIKKKGESQENWQITSSSADLSSLICFYSRKKEENEFTFLQEIQ